MKLSGQHEFSAPASEIYGRLLDPDSLRSCMPGCERLDPVSQDEFSIAMSVPIPAVKGEYEGTVSILDRQPPSSFRMRIEVVGKSGFVNADASMQVEPNGDAASIVRYEADAQIGGPAASVGQRVLTGISRRQVDQMMRCLDRSGASKPSLWSRIAAWFRARLSSSSE